MKHPTRPLHGLFARLSNSLRHRRNLGRFEGAALRTLALGILAALCFAATAFAASPYNVIYRFPAKNRGYWPTNLIADASGNLYGVTNSGGENGSGVVYLLKQKGERWTRTVLYNFPGSGMFGAGGGSLVLDQAGNLYGTAYDENTFGVVFELSPPKKSGRAWKETNIYTFSGWDGSGPSGLVVGPSGVLYGTAKMGGRDCSGLGCGTVYTLTPPSGHQHKWKRTVLYFFKGVLGNGKGDGAGPLGLTFDASGTLYGTTGGGGSCNEEDGCGGTVFELKPPGKGHTNWTESVLYRFAPGSDQLLSGVVLDQSGAMYGVTIASVYQVARQGKTWTETILTSGCYVYGGPVVDSSGNVYGTTLGCTNDGTVFKMSFSQGTWQQTVLHQFTSGRDGEAPDTGVVFGRDGALYGTTLRGGNQQCVYYENVGCGTVFRVVP